MAYGWSDDVGPSTERNLGVCAFHLAFAIRPPCGRIVFVGVASDWLHRERLQRLVVSDGAEHDAGSQGSRYNRTEQRVADEGLDQPFWLVLSQPLGLAEPHRSIA